MSPMEEACQVYLKAADRFIQAREAYRLAYSQATIESQGKTEAIRKADADLRTSGLRVVRDRLEIEAAVEWQRLLAVRGPMTDSIQPLQKFGDR